MKMIIFFALLMGVTQTRAEEITLMDSSIVGVGRPINGKVNHVIQYVQNCNQWFLGVLELPNAKDSKVVDVRVISGYLSNALCRSISILGTKTIWLSSEKTVNLIQPGIEPLSDEN